MTTLPSPTTLPSVTSTFGEGDKRSRHPGSWVRALFRWAGIWGAACLIFVSQNALRYIMRDQPVDWFNALWLEALYWVPWLALTPVLLWAARSKPLGSAAPRSHIAWHLAIAASRVVGGLMQGERARALEESERVLDLPLQVLSLCWGVTKKNEDGGGQNGRRQRMPTHESLRRPHRAV